MSRLSILVCICIANITCFCNENWLNWRIFPSLGLCWRRKVIYDRLKRNLGNKSKAVSWKQRGRKKLRTCDTPVYYVPNTRVLHKQKNSVLSCKCGIKQFMCTGKVCMDSTVWRDIRHLCVFACADILADKRSQVSHWCRIITTGRMRDRVLSHRKLWSFFMLSHLLW
jgi:hypothetical protein